MPELATEPKMNGQENADAPQNAPQNAPKKPAPAVNAALRMRIGIGVGVAVLVVGVYLFATRGRMTTDDAFIEGHIVPVSARVKGHIAKVLVDDNQTVEKGQ